MEITEYQSLMYLVSRLLHVLSDIRIQPKVLINFSASFLQKSHGFDHFDLKSKHSGHSRDAVAVTRNWTKVQLTGIFSRSLPMSKFMRERAV